MARHAKKHVLEKREKNRLISMCVRLCTHIYAVCGLAFWLSLIVYAAAVATDCSECLKQCKWKGMLIETH